LAVLRLIASSNLVGACTGRSAGFSPLRTRATWAARGCCYRMERRRQPAVVVTEWRMTSRTNLLEREEIHEKGQAQKIQVFIEEDQKVSEEGSHSEDRGETETRRKEDSRRDWSGLKRRSGEAYLLKIAPLPR
jgi:hypothetical protein